MNFKNIWIFPLAAGDWKKLFKVNFHMKKIEKNIRANIVVFKKSELYGIIKSEKRWEKCGIGKQIKRNFSIHTHATFVSGKRNRGCPTPSFNDFLGSWESWQVLWNGYHGQQFDQHPCFTTSAATTSSDYHLRRSSMPNHHCKVLVDIYFLLTEDRAIILAP